MRRKETFVDVSVITCARIIIFIVKNIYKKQNKKENVYLWLRYVRSLRKRKIAYIIQPRHSHIILYEEKRTVVVNMQLFIIILLVVSLAFALISITTNYWFQSLSNEYNEGLWVICHRPSSRPNSPLNNKICYNQPYRKSQGLAISGVILLSIAIILSIIRVYKKTDRLLIYLIILILVGSTLLLMFSYLSHPREINLRKLGYSIYFMLISSLLTLITIGLVAFSGRTNEST